MKKLLLVLVLGGALLFPIVGLADTEGTADAALTLSAVINVNVIDELTDLTLDQPALDALAVYGGSPTAPIFGTFGGSFTIELVALTNFKVEITWDYGITGGGVSTLPAGTIDSVLYLLNASSGTPPWVDIAYLPHGSVYTLTPTYFSGFNNTPGQTADFGLKVNLDNLGDRKSGDVITFTVTVTVTDNSV